MAYPEKRDGKLTGWWYGEVDLRHKGGPRMRERFDTKKGAEGWEAYVRATGERPPWSQQGTSGHTFATVAADCKREHPPWQRGKAHSVLQCLEYLCSSKLGKLPIENCTRADLQALVDELRTKRHLATSTINRYLSAASVVFKFAASDPGRYGKVTQPKFPWQDESAPREETLSPDQEKAVCRVIEEQHGKVPAFLVRVLAASGLRRGELYGLKPEQIEHDRIKLKAADTKTKAPRVVSIPPEMARELRALVASGSLPRPAQLLSIFQQAVKVCGYSEELCLHSLRHTRATRLLEAGVLPKVVMQMMGWTNYGTMARYQHVNVDMQVEAAKKVSQLGGETVETAEVVPFPASAKSSA